MLDQCVSLSALTNGVMNTEKQTKQAKPDHTIESH